MNRAAVAIVFAAATSCLAQSGLDRPPPGWKPPEPKSIVRRTKDPDTGVLVREWTVLRVARERDVKHGRETTWHPDGTKAWEREFDHGEPRGTWRSWHPNGVLASEVTFAGADVETTMSFWHANGALAATGPARDGVKQGAWHHYDSAGVLAEAGPYVDGRREGVWTIVGPTGETESFVYARGVRVPSAE